MEFRTAKRHFRRRVPIIIYTKLRERPAGKLGLRPDTYFRIRRTARWGRGYGRCRANARPRRFRPERDPPPLGRARTLTSRPSENGAPGGIIDRILDLSTRACPHPLRRTGVVTTNLTTVNGRCRVPLYPHVTPRLTVTNLVVSLPFNPKKYRRIFYPIFATIISPVSRNTFGGNLRDSPPARY